MFTASSISSIAISSDDEVLAVEEDPDHADREEERAEDQEVRQRDHSRSACYCQRHLHDPQAVAALIARAACADPGTWSPCGVRSVSAMATTIATSRITAAQLEGET